jgi:hypothetical protein
MLLLGGAAEQDSSLRHGVPDGVEGVEGVITWPQWVEGEFLVFCLSFPSYSPSNFKQFFFSSVIKSFLPFLPSFLVTST